MRGGYGVEGWGWGVGGGQSKGLLCGLSLNY